MSSSRRRLLAAALALPAAGLLPTLVPALAPAAQARPAQAQEALSAEALAAWPERSLRVVIPVAPGGSLDILGRVIARALAGPLGQPVVAENHPGAGSNLAFELVARAKPDGLTLLVGSDPLTINPALYPKVGFDPVADFAPVVEAVRAPQVLVVRDKLEARDLEGFLTLAREAEGRVTLASQGNGSIGHLGAAQLARRAGFAFTHVPYRGGGPAVVDVTAGHVDALLVTLPAAIEQIRAGRIRALAVTGAHRSPALPDVPTVAERGFPGFEVVTWQGILVPAATPAPIVARLHAEITGALARPELAEGLTRQGFEIAAGSSADFARLIREEAVRWPAVVREAGAKVD